MRVTFSTVANCKFFAQTIIMVAIAAIIIRKPNTYKSVLLLSENAFVTPAVIFDAGFTVNPDSFLAIFAVADAI
jgi:hypothetical protein